MTRSTLWTHNNTQTALEKLDPIIHTALSLPDALPILSAILKGDASHLNHGANFQLKHEGTGSDFTWDPSSDALQRLASYYQHPELLLTQATHQVYHDKKPLSETQRQDLRLLLQLSVLTQLAHREMIPPETIAQRQKSITQPFPVAYTSTSVGGTLLYPPLALLYGAAKTLDTATYYGGYVPLVGLLSSLAHYVVTKPVTAATGYASRAVSPYFYGTIYGASGYHHADSLQAQITADYLSKRAIVPYATSVAAS